MKFGVCGDPEMGRIAKAVGFDYFEWSVGGLLHPQEDEEVFRQALTAAQAVGLPCPVVNVFIPGTFKITGPGVDRVALQNYVTTALHRAEIAKVEQIVFGSGAARNILEGFDRQEAWDQLVDFCTWLASAAEQHGVVIAVEPLNVSESNIINTVEEGARLVRQVNHPHLRLLADGYHWAKDQNTVAGIVENGDLLVHTHVATVEGRRPPHPGDPCQEFFTALRQAGYDGRVSIEGKIDSPEIELPIALEIMRR